MSLTVLHFAAWGGNASLYITLCTYISHVSIFAYHRCLGIHDYAAIHAIWQHHSSLAIHTQNVIKFKCVVLEF